MHLNIDFTASQIYTMSSTKLTIGVYGIQDINDSGIPTISHDHGIAIYKDGKIIYSIQLERFDRKKHSANMGAYIYKLLKSKKLLNQPCNYIFVDNILGRSFINKQGNIRFEAPLNNNLATNIEEGKLWLLDKLTAAYALNHELAHIGSCLPFFGEFKNNSLLVHFDGGASLSNFSAWTFNNGQITSVEYNWDLKWLSSLYNANALVFSIVQAKQHELNSVPGKFMGFASLGKYSKDIAEWLKKNNFFENCWKSKKDFFDSAKNHFGVEIQHLDQKNYFIQNVATTIQTIFIDEVLNKFKTLQKNTKSDYLYYSGGSALNILLNTEIIKTNIFKDVFIPPCCNDSGLAIGAAAFFEWQINKNITVHNAFLNNWNIEEYNANYDKNTIAETAKLLLEEKVIGVCNNMGEVGPRALGNRSIISLASDIRLSQKVSMIHKQREWYRPVAPIMLEKNTKYFTGIKNVHHLSKYMLLEFDILSDKKQELIGCVHTDGTSRIQTIFEKNDNPFMYDLLQYLDFKYKVKALINTSFNSRGEPIVHNIEDALKSAENMKLDAVILNGSLKLLNS